MIDFRHKNAFKGFKNFASAKREVLFKQEMLPCASFSFELRNLLTLIYSLFLSFPKICGENLGKELSTQRKRISKPKSVSHISIFLKTKLIKSTRTLNYRLITKRTRHALVQALHR